MGVDECGVTALPTGRAVGSSVGWKGMSQLLGFLVGIAVGVVAGLPLRTQCFPCIVVATAVASTGTSVKVGSASIMAGTEYGCPNGACVIGSQTKWPCLCKWTRHAFVTTNLLAIGTACSSSVDTFALIGRVTEGTVVAVYEALALTLVSNRVRHSVVVTILDVLSGARVGCRRTRRRGGGRSRWCFGRST